MKYTRETALAVVNKMMEYEKDIGGARFDAAKITSDSYLSWKDDKRSLFVDNMEILIGDIGTGMKTIEEYRKHLKKKIEELDG